MTNNNIEIREITASDNEQMETIIRACFPEFDLPLVGTAYEDVETSNMYEAYQQNNAVYFVLVQNDVVIGGAGIKPLEGFEADTCELQKMYFSSAARGKGYGKMVFQKCLDAAKVLGYKRCYLETASQLKSAIRLYESFHFRKLDKPLGDTGHYSCGIWMLRDL